MPTMAGSAALTSKLARKHFDELGSRGRYVLKGIRRPSLLRDPSEEHTTVGLVSLIWGLECADA